MNRDLKKGSDQTDLDNLSARIKNAESRTAAGQSDGHIDGAGAEAPQSKGGNPAFDMLATVLGSMAFGWVVDRVLGTSPWIMIGMIPCGFGIVMINIWRALAKADKNAPN